MTQFRTFSIWIIKNNKYISKIRMDVLYRMEATIKIIEGAGADVKMKANERSWCYWIYKCFGEGFYNSQIITYVGRKRKRGPDGRWSRRFGSAKFWRGEVYKDGFIRYKEEDEIPLEFDTWSLNKASFSRSVFGLMFRCANPVGEYHSI